MSACERDASGEMRTALAARHASEIALVMAELRRRNVRLDDVVVLTGPLDDPCVRSIAALVHASRGQDASVELARLARANDPCFLEPFRIDHAVVVLGLLGGEVERALRVPPPEGTVRCLCFDQRGSEVCHLPCPILTVRATA